MTRLPSLPAGNANIGDVDIASLPNEGQQNMAGSISVAVASDQSAIPISDNGGSLTVDGPLTDAQLRATAVPVFGALTDAELRATPVPVSGTLGISGAVEVSNDAGNPLPVSASSLPLPTGASTSANQTTANNSLASIDGKLVTEKTADFDSGAGTDTVAMQGIALPKSGGAVAGGTSSDPLRIDPTGTSTQPISASSLPLPAGASSSANQSTIIGHLDGVEASLASIDSKTPASPATAGNQATANTALAAIQTSVETIDNAMAGSEMQVDIVAAIPSGDNPIGRVKLTDGTDVADVLDLANANPLATAIVDAAGNQITSFGGGTQYDEDTASSPADKLTMAGVVRKDSAASLVDADGDRTQLQVDASGALRVTGGGGGTEYTEDTAAPADPVGNQFMARRRDSLSTETTTDGDVTALNATGKGELYVKHPDPITVSNVATAANQSTQTTILSGTRDAVQTLDDVVVVDDGPFSPGVTSVSMIGANFDDGSPDSVDEGDAGALRMSANRSLYAQIRDAAGNERGVNVTAANALSVDGSGVTQPVSIAATIQVDVTDDATRDLGKVDIASLDQYTPVSGRLPVDGSGVTQPVSGMVTANAGTNLNTSALNLEATQADIRTAVQLIDDAVYTDGTGTPSKAVGIAGTDGTNPQIIKTDSAGELQVDVLSLPNEGQQTMANSVSVAIASDQSAVPTAPVQTTASNLKSQVQGEAAHDATIAGNPVAVGGRSNNAVPTAVSADGEAVWAWLLRTGAQMVANAPHLGMLSDPFNLTFKCAQYTTTQTGAALWTPAAGKKIVIVSIQIQAGGTTAGTLQVWFGASADTTYTRGTDAAIFDGEFAPSSTSKPGFAQTGLWISQTADHVLRVTDSAAINPLTVTVWGYEI